MKRYINWFYVLISEIFTGDWDLFCGDLGGEFNRGPKSVITWCAKGESNNWISDSDSGFEVSLLFRKALALDIADITILSDSAVGGVIKVSGADRTRESGRLSYNMNTYKD